MNKSFTILMIIFLSLSCKNTVIKENAQDEIFKTEKAFEKMVSEKGMAEAFFHFADETAVILRGKDSLIKGKENIRHYYSNNSNPNARLSWTPDYIYVSECGTLGYSYGKYSYSAPDSTGRRNEHNGIFHTIWKKQNDTWKYVWD